MARRDETRRLVVAVDVLVGDLLAEAHVDEEIVDLGVVVVSVEGVEAGGDAAVTVVEALVGDDDLTLELLLLLEALCEEKRRISIAKTKREVGDEERLRTVEVEGVSVATELVGGVVVVAVVVTVAETEGEGDVGDALLVGVGEDDGLEGLAGADDLRAADTRDAGVGAEGEEGSGSSGEEHLD